jgi:DNA-binding MarR family transcriptional regulator
MRRVAAPCGDASLANLCACATFAFVQRTAPSTDELAADLFSFLTYLVKNAEVDVFRVAAELDLSLSQIRALFVLDHIESAPALTELAPELGLSVAAAGRAVDVLARHGLVHRYEDAADRRIKRVVLTDAGRDKIARLNAARREGLRQFVSTLSDEDRERFGSALAPVLARPDVHAFLQEISP